MAALIDAWHKVTGELVKVGAEWRRRWPDDFLWENPAGAPVDVAGDSTTPAEPGNDERNSDDS